MRTPQTATPQTATPQTATPQTVPPPVVPPPLVPKTYAPLPDAFGALRIAMMARDPQTAFVYWEITADAFSRAQAHLGERSSEAQLIMRFDLDDGSLQPNATTSVDVRIEDWVGQHTFHAPAPGLRLTAGIGLLGGGLFVHIARTPPVKLPASAAGHQPVRFVHLRPEPDLAFSESTPPPDAAPRILARATADAATKAAPAPAVDTTGSVAPTVRYGDLFPTRPPRSEPNR